MTLFSVKIKSKQSSFYFSLLSRFSSHHFVLDLLHHLFPYSIQKQLNLKYPHYILHYHPQTIPLQTSLYHINKCLLIPIHTHITILTIGEKNIKSTSIAHLSHICTAVLLLTPTLYIILTLFDVAADPLQSMLNYLLHLRLVDAPHLAIVLAQLLLQKEGKRNGGKRTKGREGEETETVIIGGKNRRKVVTVVMRVLAIVEEGALILLPLLH